MHDGRIPLICTVHEHKKKASFIEHKSPSVFQDSLQVFQGSCGEKEAPRK